MAGLVIGIGEIFGGGAAPAIAGFIAQNYGLEHTLTFALIMQVVGLVIALALQETAPIKAQHTVSDLDKLEEQLGGVAKN